MPPKEALAIFWCKGISAAFAKARTKAGIEAEYRATLTARETENTAAVSEAENILFTTFTRDIASKITVTPQYIKDRAAELNQKLWELVAGLLAEQGYIVDNETRTAVLPPDTAPPELFYYWTGTRNKPYRKH